MGGGGGLEEKGIIREKGLIENLTGGLSRRPYFFQKRHKALL